MPDLTDSEHDSDNSDDDDEEEECDNDNVNEFEQVVNTNIYPSFRKL